MQRKHEGIYSILLACLFVAFVHGQTDLPAPVTATLTVSGDVPSRLVLKAGDLAKMPRETVTIPEQDGTKVAYEGVLLREILKKAGAPAEKELRGKALASYLVAKAHDGYQVVFTLAEVAPEFANERILVADKRDGKHFSATRVHFVCWRKNHTIRPICRGWARQSE